jgi:capsular exopolysaccharide synthesis family protein
MQQEQAELRLAELQREADADRNLFETFLIRTKETGGNEYQEADARVISAAELPTRPSFPKVVPMVGAAFAASLCLGVFLAFGVDRLQNGFRSPQQVERLTGLPVLRTVPALAGSVMGKTPPFQYVLNEPTSAYAEALQAVRTALHFSRPDAPPRTLLVTSGTSAEGKSTLAISLARMAARSGQKVLLADCDLRRPSIAQALKLSTLTAMEDVLTGRATISNAVTRDEATGLHIIPARSSESQPLDLLSSDRMRDFLREAAKTYDFVVIDSPPASLVSDALVLSELVDTTLYLIRWEATPRDVALAGVEQLRRAGAKIVGAVLNLAKLDRHGGYGYGDTTYYASASKKRAA